MHEVIVYHNPASAWFWHMLRTGDGIGMFAAVISMAAVWLIIVINIEKLHKNRHRHSAPVSAISGWLHNYQFWIANLTTAAFGWGMHTYFTYYF